MASPRFVCDRQTNDTSVRTDASLRACLEAEQRSKEAFLLASAETAMEARVGYFGHLIVDESSAIPH